MGQRNNGVYKSQRGAIGCFSDSDRHFVTLGEVVSQREQDAPRGKQTTTRRGDEGQRIRAAAKPITARDFAPANRFKQQLRNCIQGAYRGFEAMTWFNRFERLKEEHRQATAEKSRVKHNAEEKTIEELTTEFERAHKNLTFTLETAVNDMKQKKKKSGG